MSSEDLRRGQGDDQEEQGADEDERQGRRAGEVLRRHDEGRGDVTKRRPEEWQRGYGRWVRDVLVWTKAPLLFRNELVAVDGLAGEPRAAEPGEVKRVGSDPVILPLAADGGPRAELLRDGIQALDWLRNFTW